ncbi:MAG TPA: cell division protein FtsL [Pyrinomonadaceae bacterium]|jgi:Cell division protein FtsL.|nr:cell division protein FtsL [Pyrinomonadaceae bacterium]
MERFPEHQRNAKVLRARDVTALSRLALLLFCGLALSSGFVLAAEQHFVAVQDGYKSESLRNERKKLIEDNQRLALEKEMISAPSRLEQAARQLGLEPTTAGQIAQSDSARQSNSKTVVTEPKTEPKTSAKKASTR